MFENIKSEDWARLAAYIDGEGYIAVKRVGVKRSHCMQVTITNTDVRLVLWLKDTFGGEYRTKGKTSTRRQIWYWYAGSALANDLLSQCLPYFIMKRDQAEIAIAFHRTVSGAQRFGTVRNSISEETFQTRCNLEDQLKQAREDAAPVIN